MKIIDINKNITQQALFSFINEKLNPAFHQQRDNNTNFLVELKGDVVEISQPDLYEGFLFAITINGQHIEITQSEHYVDDVNSLTIESILNTIFEELSGDKGLSLTLEG